MDFQDKLSKLLNNHGDLRTNLSRQEMIRQAVERKEAIVAANGALATWTPPESTGRAPKDTYIVRHPETQDQIDWDSPNNIPMEPSTFDMLFEDAMETLSKKQALYITDRVLGADPTHALPVRTIGDYALTALFVDNMFRPETDQIKNSCFAGRGFTLLAVPYDKLDRDRYAGRLRKLPNGKTSNLAVVADLDRRMGIVYGSAYGGSVKKLMFTVMNFMLPGEDILPLHCSANEGPDGDIALLLGLSGTGKTTLSADPDRALLGDDEHSWCDNGVANFENGCYAKLINLRKEKEPEIYNAVLHDGPYLEHGVIIENTMMYPDGHFDLDDERLTPNSRASYPLSYLSNIKTPPVGSHPKTILFLTADANGVLPPVSKLNSEQAMLWFLMGYTSKLAGTETGIVDPVSAFSRFFGEPFMPRNPDVYARMLGERMKKHGAEVYLINTGWSGGPFGVGARMDITMTRRMITAAMNGSLDNVPYEKDDRFHVMVPKECPNVPAEILQPKNTWADKAAYEARANKLAGEFSAHFDKAYGNKNIDPEVAKQCPGK